MHALTAIVLIVRYKARAGPTRMWLLHGDSAGMDNTLANPFNVSPVAGPGPQWGSGGTVLRLILPRLSFAVVVSDLI